MTGRSFTRAPSRATAQARSGSSPGATVDCPLPLLLITGLTTHGTPIACTAAVNCSTVEANRYGEVGRPSSSAASRRMPSRSIVRRVARAVGTTRTPSASSASSSSVARASTSGTTRSGRTSCTSARRATGSVMSSTRRWGVTRMAGASS